MAEPIERRSNRSSKPKVHFDGQIAQLPRLSGLSISSKPSARSKPAAKRTKPTTKPSKSSSTSIIPSNIKPTSLSAIQSLCSGIEGLEIDGKAKKKAKAEEIARLTTLDLKSIMEEAKPPKEVQFEPFDLGDRRDLKPNIPSNVDASDPLALLDLFIPLEMYTIIAKNTNLYAISKDAPTTQTDTNSRYWFPTNEDEIRVLFGILYYIGVH
jgi:hypothetical protein